MKTIITNTPSARIRFRKQYLLLGVFAVILGAIICYLWWSPSVSSIAGDLAARLARKFFGQFDVFLSPIIYVVVSCVFVLERLIPAEKSRPIFSVGLAQDFAWFILNFLPLPMFVVVWGGVLKLFYDNYLAFLTIRGFDDWPTIIRLTLAVLLMDFIRWFHHFVRHRVEFFWRFHAIHHSQQQLNFFTDYRVHFVDSLMAITISFIPFYMFGATAETSTYLVLFLRWYTGVYHGNLRTNYGVLKYIMVTPQSHRVHHSNDPAHYNTNFGVTFSIWDRLFGTLHKSYDDYPATGVPDPVFPLESGVSGSQILTNYWPQNAYPFREVYRKLTSHLPAIE
jgi:sterol desaturase/sphingolipid hydroxylase (fatty acid hydroxylase superfamily)